MRDGAAVGLGLLGNPAGADRLPAILQRSMPKDRDGRTAAENLKTDAALALKAIGAEAGVHALGQALVAAGGGVAVTPAPAPVTKARVP